MKELLTCSWEQRLAIRYYNRLFKEYALVDLTYYKVNKIGMRWRTEKEVIDGKGQFTCGEVHCSNINTKDLCSFEVPFKYSTKDGQKKSTLVKVRLCGPCALKLYYRKIREYEGNDNAKRQRRKECETSKEIFDYIHDVLKEDELLIEAPQPPEPSIPQNASPAIVSKRVAQPVEETVREKKPRLKAPKLVNGHSHYSSSSESESEAETVPVQESHQEKELDANGNEVISTSNDVWKTNIEVEHTENEKMDDFINQLFMCYLCSNQHNVLNDNYPNKSDVELR